VHAVFIFAFVQWFQGNFDEKSIATDLFLRRTRVAVIAGVVIISVLADDENFKAQVVDGFGNGRVSFSIWLVQLLFLGYISPLSAVYPRTSMLRDVATLPASQVFEPGGVVDKLDRLSGYRLGITVNAVAARDTRSLLLGKGVMNFQGAAIGELWQVHNIFVCTLGELGLAGLLARIFFFRGEGISLRLSGAFCLIYLMIGMLHPDLLLTAISTCLIFWVAYAALLKQQLKISELRLVA
jgi:hypothetical protein